ncbi:alpha/beta hydrolase [Leuconostoc mesenteroides]|nr:alpha/beta hydrolase [Leuconostoc mesenteroides]
MISIVSLNNKRSWQSVLFEKIIHPLPLVKDERKKNNFDKAMIDGETPYQLPKNVKKQFNIHNINGLDGPTFELLPRNEKFSKTIYYLHGGAYWWQPFFLHFRMLQNIANQNQARIIIPIYPKSPRYTADDVFPYILNNYKTAVKKFHLMSSALTLMGDSAGGGLCLSLLQLLENEKIDKPSKVILFSPWLDISNSNPDMKSIQPKDPLLNIEALAYQGDVYSGTFNTNSPLVSPINADFSKFPPVYIFSGSHDILYADVKKLSHKSNKNVNYYIFPKMDHVFIAFPIPESEKALEIVTRVISEQSAV